MASRSQLHWRSGNSVAFLLHAFRCPRAHTFGVSDWSAEHDQAPVGWWRIPPPHRISQLSDAWRRGPPRKRENPLLAEVGGNAAMALDGPRGAVQGLPGTFWDRDDVEVIKEGQ